MPAKPKITDEQFIEAYVAAGGSYEGTANYIQQNFDVPFTRGAVMKRVKRYPDLQRDVRDLKENEFDDHLLKFAEDGANDIRLRARIYLQMKIQLNRLNNKTQKASNASHSFQPQGPDGFDIDGNILDFSDDADDEEAMQRIMRGEPGPGLEAYLEKQRKKLDNDGIPN
jgi:hypothetical protein